MRQQDNPTDGLQEDGQSYGLSIFPVRIDPMQLTPRFRKHVGILNQLLARVERDAGEGDPVNALIMQAQVLGALQMIDLLDTDGFAQSEEAESQVARMHANMQGLYLMISPCVAACFNLDRVQKQHIVPDYLQGLDDLATDGTVRED